MKFLAHIFVFFCFFPYINLLQLGTDTQPNALLVASLLLFGIKKKSINGPIIMLWLLFAFSILLYFKSTVSIFDYLKNCFNYLSLPLTCMGAYVIYKHLDYKIEFKTFLYIIGTYAFVGFMQIYFDPGFGTFTLTDSGRGVLVGGRGAISLTPEPAFYGTICLFFMAFSLLTYNKKQNQIAIGILMLQILLFARSSTAMMILTIALFLFTIIQILRFKLKYVTITAVVLVITVPIVNRYLDELDETRMGQITTELITNPLLITQLDGSVGTRLTGAVSPFFAFKHNKLLPMGIGNYKYFLKDIYTRGYYRSFLTSEIINQKDRLGGSMNMVLFQLGILGLLMPLAIFLAFRRRLKESSVLFVFILFCTILFTQIQMMHSMIGFIIATALFTTRIKPRSKLAK